MDATDRYIDEHLQAFRSDFDHLISIPSISTDPSHEGDVRRAAEWVAARMERAGLEAAVVETEGHPLVMGRHEAGPDAPTLLVYAHYDVQPADPLDEWTSPPFQATEVGDRLVGRGTADDKAQVILQIAAAEAALATGGLPVNLILLFEGEEEIGSAGLSSFLRAGGSGVEADHVIIADSMMFAPGRPSLLFGMRGVSYMEIEVRSSAHDLHSGQYGGAVPNPAHVLSGIIASFHDERGRVAVEGFYDEVRSVSDELRREWAALGFDERAYQASAGGAALVGEEGYSTPERLWIRPCLDVNGFLSGYTGPGKKTVLPARAMAKVSCRLVPAQDPDTIVELVRAHVLAQAPPGVEVQVHKLQADPPWHGDPTGPLFTAAGAALEAVFGAAPVRVAGGGTLPIARTFSEVLTSSVAVMGMALPGANMHAPNEWFPAAHLHLGAKAVVRLYRELAASG
jgi:acetylornithine deacetylase/succinyl-diaminopimelate desuccinylase-like protein